jgi:large subunit ribosomal protein L28
MITGKGVQVGNNVSHAKNRTRRRFLPNVQETTIFSEVLGRNISLKATTNGLRTIEVNGGIDAWLMSVAPSKLDPKLRPWRAKVAAAMEKKKAAK